MDLVDVGEAAPPAAGVFERTRDRVDHARVEAIGKRKPATTSLRVPAPAEPAGMAASVRILNEVAGRESRPLSVIASLKLPALNCRLESPFHAFPAAPGQAADLGRPR